MFDRYQTRARSRWPTSSEIRLPVVPANCEIAYHMFYLLVRDRSTRDAVLERMRADGIHPTFHYVPLHSSDAGRRFSAEPTECPVTDDISGRLIRLPFYNNVTPEESRARRGVARGRARRGRGLTTLQWLAWHLDTHAGSSSLRQPDYWWYRARSGLLQAALSEFVGSASRVLDVGSADGPSVGWMQESVTGSPSTSTRAV